MIEASAARCHFSLSRHARTRSQQRAIRPKLLAYVLKHSDFEVDAGGGCRALRIGSHFREPCRDANERELDERARRLRCIENADGRIVTVMWGRRRRHRTGGSKSATGKGLASVLREFRMTVGVERHGRCSE